MLHVASPENFSVVRGSEKPERSPEADAASSSFHWNPSHRVWMVRLIFSRNVPPRIQKPLS